MFYEESYLVATLNDDIDMSLAFSSLSESYTDTLNFVLSVTSLNGTWLGYQSVDTQFFFCGMAAPFSHLGGGTNSYSKWLKVGYSYSTTYPCQLSTVFEEEMVFYELFITDDLSDTLVPVPVRITNLKNDNGALVNENVMVEDEVDDILTHRFFLLDTQSGITSSSTNEALERPYPAEYVRYASSMKMSIKIREEDPEKIYPPILTITYSDAKNTWTTDEESQVDIEFTVEYIQDTNEFWETVNGFFITLLILTFLLWGLRINNWRKRIERSGGNESSAAAKVGSPFGPSSPFQSFITLSVLGMHSFVLIFFPFTFMICGYWFAFFKLQSSVFVMLPPLHTSYESFENEYYPFYTIINLLFFFHMFYIAHTIWKQVFF